MEDKATLALVSRNATSSSYNLSLISDKSDKSSGSGGGGAGGTGTRGAPTITTNSPVLRSGAFFAGGGTGSSTGAQSRVGADPHAATLRVFHLVRPSAAATPGGGAEHGMMNMQDGGQVGAGTKFQILTEWKILSKN